MFCHCETVLSTLRRHHHDQDSSNPICSRIASHQSCFKSRETQPGCSFVFDETLILIEIVCALCGTRRSHPHNSQFLRKKILCQLVRSGLRGEIESMPVTVLYRASTNRRDCSTQQAVRSAADLGNIVSKTRTSRLHPRIDHCIIKTQLIK